MELAEIEEMRNVDIRTVDAELLADIDKIEINRNLPKEERLREFARKVKNPYCFICNGIIVKSSYTETGESLETKLARLCLEMDV